MIKVYTSSVIDAPAGSYPIRLVEADRRIGSIVISD